MEECSKHKEHRENQIKLLKSQLQNEMQEKDKAISQAVGEGEMEEKKMTDEHLKKMTELNKELESVKAKYDKLKAENEKIEIEARKS